MSSKQPPQPQPQPQQSPRPQEVSTVRVIVCGMGLIFGGAWGFHSIDHMLEYDYDSTSSRWINCIYCSIMTLTTVGFGDICPTTKINHVGQLFVISLALAGLGMFCGPILTLTSTWKHQIPGGLLTLATVTLALGVLLFTTTEHITQFEALYLSIITFTTIGYGDLTPQTDAGKLATALYALLAINVAGAFLQPAQDFLTTLCSTTTTTTNTIISGAEQEKREDRQTQKLHPKQQQQQPPPKVSTTTTTKANATTTATRTPTTNIQTPRVVQPILATDATKSKIS